MLSHHKNSVEKITDPFVAKLGNVHPNILTLVGSIPSLLFFVFMLQHWYVAALISFAGTSLDMLDGMVARKFGKTSAFGGFLDSFTDRIADFLIITAFSFSGIVRWEIAAPLMLFAYLTSYARSRGELANSSVSFAIGMIERTERLIVIFIGLLFYVLFPYVLISGLNLAEVTFILVGIFSLYTVIQRVHHAYKKL